MTTIRTASARPVGWLAATALAAAGVTGIGAPAQAAHGGIAIVHDLRVGAHTGFDRVVIDYHGLRPGVRVRVVDRLVQCASGDVISMPGDRAVRIKLEPAQVHRPSGSLAYRGPGLGRTTTYSLKSIRGVRLACAFEGQVVFGIGIRDNVDALRVRFLRDPKRIVVDLRR